MEQEDNNIDGCFIIGESLLESVDGEFVSVTLLPHCFCSLSLNVSVLML